MLHNFTDKATLLLLSFSLFFASSCDQEEQPVNPLLVSVQVSADFISSFDNHRVYLLASDSEGNILEYRQLENDQTFELNSSSYTESTFTLSFIETIQYTTGSQQKNLNGKSFHGIKRGSKFLLKKQLPGYGNAGFFNFTVQNFDDGKANEYTLASNGGISHVTNPTYQGNPVFNGEYVLYSRNPTRLFIAKYGADKKPLGYLFPPTTYTVSQKYMIDVDGVYSAFQTEVANISDFVSAGVTVYGRPFIDNYEEFYNVSSSSTLYNKSLTIYYPGTAFPGYASHSWLNRTDSYYENFNKSVRSDFDFLKVEATMNVSGQTINFSLKGDNGIALFGFRFITSDNEFYNWDSFASVNSNQSIVLPRLPAEITANFGAYSYSSWEPETQVEILQLEDVTSLEEYAASKANGTWLGSLNFKYAHVNSGSSFVGEHRFRYHPYFFKDGF